MLVLVEGIPGSGKSSTAHALQIAFERRGIPVRWWYEEEQDHPVYCFHDLASLRQVVADLTAGRHEQVIAAALAQWEQFAAGLAAAKSVTILDGCFFGYLTWSLFPLDLPEERILTYLARVEQVLQSTDPKLIYLRKSDLAAAFQEVAAARGEQQVDAYIRKATQSTYGQRRGMTGFDGLVRFWTNYQSLLDRAFEHCSFAKLAVDVVDDNWPAVYRRINDFVALPPEPDLVPALNQFDGFVGRYVQESANGALCEIRLQNGQLFVHGLPGLWPRVRLVAKTQGLFYLDALPFEIHFEADEAGAVLGVRIEGPDLLGAPSIGGLVFRRAGEQGNQAIG